MLDKATIHCSECGVLIRTEEKTSFIFESTDYECSEKYLIAQCPSCFSVLFGRKTFTLDDSAQTFVWKTVAERLWPDPLLSDVPSEIPAKARQDIIEAKKCFSYEIYSAAAVLCGKALERLVKEKAGNHTIARGLQELKTNQIIDQRLFDWGDALRKERNIGAHASDEEITKDDARDIIDFTIAIFDYVYRLSTKYESYMARKNKIF